MGSLLQRGYLTEWGGGGGGLYLHALISDTNKKQGSLLINVPKIAITFEKYHCFLKCNVNLFCINHLALTITSLATSTGSMQCENKQFKLELGVEGGGQREEMW